MNIASATRAIDQHGMLLVFPLQNRPDPPSVWSVAYPKLKMRWEWDDDADNRVVKLWHLREKLARSGDVVYSKWFRNRATLFSMPVFRSMLVHLSAAGDLEATLSHEARDLYSLLTDDSPISTKELKKRADMRGREYEAAYTRAMSQLFARLLIVGFGEVNDGAFPSLAVGATSLLFEDAWLARNRRDIEDDEALHHALTSSKAFAKAWNQTLASVKTAR